MSAATDTLPWKQVHQEIGGGSTPLLDASGEDLGSNPNSVRIDN